MKLILALITALLVASQLVAHAEAAVVVYPQVPGLASSKHYQVRVRTKGDGSKWQSAFCWETVCKKVEKGTDAYFDHLADWTHTYVNFEMSGAVEIEIRRANGQPIRTAAVHPKRKASACSVKDGGAEPWGPLLAGHRTSISRLELGGRMIQHRDLA